VCGSGGVSGPNNVKTNNEKLKAGHYSTSTDSAAAAAAAAAAAGDDGGDGFSFTQPEFANTRLIYASKSTGELLRAYLVFALCSFDVLVNYQSQVDRLSASPFPLLQNL